jgi:glycosyltransferase involved in cell wall biosynthesis
MRAHIVDPSAFTRPYDHALCAALGRAGVDVELITSRFAYGTVPDPDGYTIKEAFYRHARGAAGSTIRRATKLAEHVPDMLRYRKLAEEANVVHFQWLDVQWLDGLLLPRRPTVLTAHDLLPREPRPGQARAQRRLYEAVDAIVTHSAYGRGQLVGTVGVDPAKVHVIHHGAFEHLAHQSREEPLPADLEQVRAPVALFFGLLRPYKGLDTLLEAWREIEDAELWIVGRPMMDLAALRRRAPKGVRFVTGFVPEAQLPAYFRRAELIVLPYARTERFDQSGVLATALAFGTPAVLSDVGGFGEVAAAGAARLVAPGDAGALHTGLSELLGDAQARERLAAGAAAAARGEYSWSRAAAQTLALYRKLSAGSQR